MSDTTEQGQGAAVEAPLQFDKAEIDDAGTAPAAPTCVSCKRPAAPTYYNVGAVVFCTACHAMLVQAIEAGAWRGRFWRAALHGLGAALLGSVVWYAIREATGYEIGLVAVGVGILVGMAVKRGSKGFGGKRYQALAMGLTYLSVTLANVPVVLKAVAGNAEKPAIHASSASGSPQGPVLAPPAADEPSAPPASASEPAPVHDGGVAGPPMGVGGFLLGCALILGVALAAPFLAGMSGLMGIIIIGIGLYQAWKINKYVAPPIRGPFAVGASDGPVAAHG